MTMSIEIPEDEYHASIFPNSPFGPIPDEAENQQWNQIHFLFGKAMLWAQAYEDGMTRFVVVAESRWKRSGKTEEKIWRMTLRQLEKEYELHCHLERHQYKRMEKVRKLRNSIAHKFYRHRMALLQSAEGRDQVIRELHEAIRMFEMARDEMYWFLNCLTGQPLV